MGIFDTFEDRDVRCPHCRSKLDGEWQTKELYNLLQRWKKGDFVQYKHRGSKRRKKEEWPEFGRVGEWFSDVPLMMKGRVPVHAVCRRCDYRLDGFAFIENGHFKKVGRVKGRPIRKLSSSSKPKKLKLSNFAGAWKMTDKEVENTAKALNRFWGR